MKKTFSDRDELVAYLRDQMHSPSDETASPIRGGLTPVARGCDELDVVSYGATRNHLDGAVTRLSPYIRHGLLTLNSLRNQALDQVGAARAEGFVRQLAWRDFWQQLYSASPELVWQNIEPYKTGFDPSDYKAELPDDIACGRTGITVIDQFIATLLETGYLHNHIRLYLASYIVHWRQIKWQAGAKWFLYHLLDADPASNNFHGNGSPAPSRISRIFLTSIIFANLLAPTWTSIVRAMQYLMRVTTRYKRGYFPICQQRLCHDPIAVAPRRRFAPSR